MLIFTLCRAVVDVGDSLVHHCGIIVKVVIELALIDQLRMLGIHSFSLNSNLQVGLSIDSLEDLSKCSLTYLLNDLEIFTNFLQFLHF